MEVLYDIWVQLALFLLSVIVNGLTEQPQCAFVPIPSQQRVFLWRVLILLFHWARPLRQTRPVRGIPGGLPAGSGPGQAQDLEEPLETLLPQAQEGRVRHHPASSDLAFCKYPGFKCVTADRHWYCSGGRWIQTTVRRSNRLHLTTVGLGCWTSWIWPFLTSSWVSRDVWHLTNSPKGKRFACSHGSLVCFLWQHRKHGSAPLWDLWKVWKRDLHHPSGQWQRVRHCSARCRCAHGYFGLHF